MSEFKMVKRTNYAKSYSVSTLEYNDLMLNSDGTGGVRLEIRSAIDDKLIAVLDEKDVKFSLLNMMPSLQSVVGKDGGVSSYWVCNIPTKCYRKK